MFLCPDKFEKFNELLNDEVQFKLDQKNNFGSIHEAQTSCNCTKKPEFKSNNSKKKEIVEKNPNDSSESSESFTGNTEKGGLSNGYLKHCLRCNFPKSILTKENKINACRCPYFKNLSSMKKDEFLEPHATERQCNCSGIKKTTVPKEIQTDINNTVEKLVQTDESFLNKYLDRRVSEKHEHVNSCQFSNRCRCRDVNLNLPRQNVYLCPCSNIHQLPFIYVNCTCPANPQKEQRKKQKNIPELVEVDAKTEGKK